MSWSKVAVDLLENELRSRFVAEGPDPDADFRRVLGDFLTLISIFVSAALRAVSCP